MLTSFFLNATPTTQIYTLSLHDALPISERPRCRVPPVHDLVPGHREPGHLNLGVVLVRPEPVRVVERLLVAEHRPRGVRSEEHTSELQSHSDLVCRLLLEKKKKVKTTDP